MLLPFTDWSFCPTNEYLADDGLDNTWPPSYSFDATLVISVHIGSLIGGMADQCRKAISYTSGLDKCSKTRCQILRRN